MNIIILNAARQIEEVWRIKSRQTKVQQSYNVIMELKDNHGNKITGQED